MSHRLHLFPLPMLHIKKRVRKKKIQQGEEIFLAILDFKMTLDSSLAPEVNPQPIRKKRDGKTNDPLKILYQSISGRMGMSINECLQARKGDKDSHLTV